jgi:hypothetical protein
VSYKHVSSVEKRPLQIYRGVQVVGLGISENTFITVGIYAFAVVEGFPLAGVCINGG